MALRKAFCPNCGQPTQIDDTKDSCFCLSCGNKISVPKREQPAIEVIDTVAEQEQKKSVTNVMGEQTQTIAKQEGTCAPEDKLKEVEFYYKLSAEKKEYADINGEPKYYLKGQDLLVDLSQQYGADYRVWWELCKPMDFNVIIAGEKSINQSTINSSYFDKALDLAPLEIKMELIKQHDIYIESKGRILKDIQTERERREAEEKTLIEEQQRKEREAEEERRRKEREAEEERRRKEREAEEEHQRKEQLRLQEVAERERQERAAAEQREAEFLEVQQILNPNIWASLAGKDYSMLDNSYFQFKSKEGMTIVVSFKVITNVLYLNAFHIDSNKNNAAYIDQSIAIRFADNGIAIKFDNKPVAVRGWNPGANNIQVMANPEGGCMVNGFVLVQDANYVNSLNKMAKKPFVASKIFI